MESNKRFYIIRGVSGLLTLLMGLGVFLVYRYGSLNDSTLWIIIAVVGIVAFLFISGIFFLPRTRIQRSSRTLEFGTDQHNREYFETTQQREEKDFIPSKKQESIFCNYCGIELHKSTRICPNCGQKVD